MAEGPENGLSVQQVLPDLPVWVVMSAGNMAKAVLPESVRKVILLADHDQAGLNAATNAAQVHHATGRRVWIVTPPGEGEDFNDMLQKAGPEAIKTAVETATEWTPNITPQTQWSPE